MRKFAVVAMVVLLAVVCCQASASASQGGVQISKQQLPDKGQSSPNSPAKRRAKAAGMSRIGKPGSKAGATCDITCSDGSGGTVPWRGVDACCGACMFACLESCDAWSYADPSDSVSCEFTS